MVRDTKTIIDIPIRLPKDCQSIQASSWLTLLPGHPFILARLVAGIQSNARKSVAPLPLYARSLVTARVGYADVERIYPTDDIMVICYFTKEYPEGFRVVDLFKKFGPAEDCVQHLTRSDTLEYVTVSPPIHKFVEEQFLNWNG